MPNVLPMRTTNRLRGLYERLQSANQSWMDARAIALEMLGLDADNLQIGIDFNTGIIQVPTPLAPPVEPSTPVPSGEGPEPTETEQPA